MDNKKWLWVLTSLTIIILVLVLGPYLFFLGDLPISEVTQDWGAFGDYFGGIVGPVFAFLTILYLVYSNNRNFELLNEQNSKLAQELRIAKSQRDAQKIYNMSSIKHDLINSIFEDYEGYRKHLDIVYSNTLISNNLNSDGSSDEREKNTKILQKGDKVVESYKEHTNYQRSLPIMRVNLTIMTLLSHLIENNYTDHMHDLMFSANLFDDKEWNIFILYMCSLDNRSLHLERFETSLFRGTASKQSKTNPLLIDYVRAIRKKNS